MARNKYYRKPKFGSKEYFQLKVTNFKRGRGRSNAYAMIFYGVIMNIVGTVMGLIKAHMDKDVIQTEIEKKFMEIGITLNGTEVDSEGLPIEPSSILLVLITMFGRMCNVMGTIKIFQGIEKLISNRRKKKLKETTERLKNGETQAEATEILADCCQIF